MTEKQKIIIGCEEWCGFPELGVPAIIARVDSGAKTSSIHAFNIHPFHVEGKLWVRFEIHPLQRDRKTTIPCVALVIDRRKIKSSNGRSEKRYVISSPLQMGGYSWNIELTLANRDTMGYRMLLGREAMIGRILVDPGRSMCQGEFSDSEIASFYGIRKKSKSRKKQTNAL